MKTKTLTVLTLLVAFSSAFSQEQNKSNSDSTFINAPYLGQEPPGLTPEIFASGLISTANHERGMVFSSDGKELVFQKRGVGFTSVLVGMKQVNDAWSNPEILSFSGIPSYKDVCPMYSPDGQSIFFASKRPMSTDETLNDDYDIWVSTKKENSWSNPVNIGDEINSEFEEEDFSIASDGTIYFSSDRPGIGSYDIYKSRMVSGKYQKPELLKGLINTEGYEGYPQIAPDKSYLIFLSDRDGELGGGDLFISFKNDNGSWGKIFNLGSLVNSEYHEAAPTLSPDGKYLFFTSFRPTATNTDREITYNQLTTILNNPGNGSGDIYWVDTRAIGELKSDFLK